MLFRTFCIGMFLSFSLILRGGVLCSPVRTELSSTFIMISMDGSLASFAGSYDCTTLSVVRWLEIDHRANKLFTGCH